MRERDKLVIWPVYFNSAKKRSEGRKVPKGLAVDSPTLKEVEDVAKILGFNPRLVTDVSYPRSWWERCGCVLIDKRESKSQALRKIAKKLRETRHLK